MTDQYCFAVFLTHVFVVVFVTDYRSRLSIVSFMWYCVVQSIYAASQSHYIIAQLNAPPINYVKQWRSRKTDECISTVYRVWPSGGAKQQSFDYSPIIGDTASRLSNGLTQATLPLQIAESHTDHCPAPLALQLALMFRFNKTANA